MGGPPSEEDPPLLPAGLERRRGCAALSGFGALALVLGTTAEWALGPDRPATVWLALLGAAVVLAVVAVAVARSITPEERDLIERSGRAVLPALPLPPGGEPPVVRVPLRPGWFATRRVGGRPELLAVEVDRTGVSVPAWLIEGRPRTVDPLGTVAVPWADVARWQVRTDSDGPDTHELRTTRPWAGDVTRSRWPALRFRRHEVVDEEELLRAVRLLGQLPVEVEPGPTVPGRPGGGAGPTGAG